jgi:hypothetical protein
MKLVVTSLAPVSDEEIRRNEANARSLGFPKHGTAEVQRVAIVGGGNSIKDKIEELRAFDGEVWAINGAFGWCRANGIAATFYSLDPSESIAVHCVGVKRAVLALSCHPRVFEAVKHASLDVFDLNAMETGPTSASCVMVPIEKGHRELHFYGCESGFEGGSHIYGSFADDSVMRVCCDGRSFLTTPDMMMQAEFLGGFIRTAPNLFKDCSGGLLAAVVNDPNIDVIAASRSLYEQVKRNAAIDEAHNLGVEYLMSKEYRDLLERA